MQKKKIRNHLNYSPDSQLKTKVERVQRIMAKKANLQSEQPSRGNEIIFYPHFPTMALHGCHRAVPVVDSIPVERHKLWRVCIGEPAGKKLVWQQNHPVKMQKCIVCVFWWRFFFLPFESSNSVKVFSGRGKNCQNLFVAIKTHNGSGNTSQKFFHKNCSPFLSVFSSDSITS